MSRLQELIEQHCPDGVERVELSKLVQKTSNIKWAEHEGEEYSYIDLTSVDRQMHTIGDTVIIDADSAPSRAQQVVHADDVLFGGTRPTLMRYCLVPDEYDGQIASTGYVVLRAVVERILPRYLMHCLGTDEFVEHLETWQKGSAYPAITRKDLLKYRIPVPPIEVQREIARLLDTYTAAHDALVHQLSEEADLSDMRFLALCDSLICADKRVERKHLESLGKLERGKRFTAADYVNDGVGCIHYGEVYTDYGLSAISTVSHISREKSEGMRFAHKGDVVIACTGENKEDICKPVVWLGDDDVAVHDDCRIFRHGINGKFISYALLTSEFCQQKVRAATESKVVRVSGDKLSKMSIPVPSAKAQEEIVEYLDSAIELRDGLRSEIMSEVALLKAQLNEFRNQLLVFPEKAT